MKFVCALWIVVFWEVFCSGTVEAVSSVVVTENVALGKPCNMTSSYTSEGFNNSCATAINGDTSGVYVAGNCIHTETSDNYPRWNVDLGHYYNITSIVIYARLIHLARMPGVSVYIDNSKVYEFDTEPASAMITIPVSPAVSGRVVSITKNETMINICEVQVLAIEERGFLLVCPGDNAYFNWTVNAGHRITQILNIEWFYAGNSRELMALLDHDHFIILPAFSGRLQHFGNASIMLSHVLAMDSGNYSVEVITTEVGTGHSTASLYGDVVLRVAEEPVLTNKTLVAVENSQAVLDPRTGQWSIELLCGTFQYLGDPPVHMVWQTPNDSKPIASSSYRDGHFRLLLTHPIQGGQYTCLPNTSKNISFPAEDGCLKSSASVTVDAVADTMILYQAEIHDLKNKLNNATSCTTCCTSCTCP